MPGEPFTEEEKADIYRFLGYPNYEDALAATIGLGQPGQLVQVLFTLRTNIDRLAPPSRDRVREALCELRSIESQQTDARRRLRATQIGELRTNPMELGMLQGEYMRWRTKLADLFGVSPNPYSQQEAFGFGGGISGKVIG